MKKIVGLVYVIIGFIIFMWSIIDLESILSIFSNSQQVGLFGLAITMIGLGIAIKY